MATASNHDNKPLLNALPQTLDLASGKRLGAVTLTWDAGKDVAVELRLDAPDGQLFHRGGGTGDAATGQWVRDGTVFYLRHASANGEALASVVVDLPVTWMGLEMKDIVRNLVANVLLRDATQALIVPSHPRSIVFRVKAARDTVYFKCYLAIESDLIAIEAWAYERLSGIGVPVPTVLALDLTRQSFPAAFMVLSELAGQAMDSIHDSPGDMMRTLYRQAGVHLARMHAVEVAGFGGLDASYYRRSGDVRGSVASWDAFIEAKIADLVQRLDSSRGPAPALVAHVRSAARSLRAAAGPFVGSARLIHGDFDGSQVFVNPDSGFVTGLLDFDDVAAGDPAWDLATIGSRDGAKALEAVLEGYAPDATLTARLEESRALYEMVDRLMATVSAYERGSIEEGADALDRLLDAAGP